jgi:hypothetical protein
VKDLGVFSELLRNLSELCKHANRDLSNDAYSALEAFLHQVGQQRCRTLPGFAFLALLGDRVLSVSA